MKKIILFSFVLFAFGVVSAQTGKKAPVKARVSQDQKMDQKAVNARQIKLKQTEAAATETKFRKATFSTNSAKN